MSDWHKLTHLNYIYSGSIRSRLYGRRFLTHEYLGFYYFVHQMAHTIHWPMTRIVNMSVIIKIKFICSPTISTSLIIRFKKCQQSLFVVTVLKFDHLLVRKSQNELLALKYAAAAAIWKSSCWLNGLYPSIIKFNFKLNWLDVPV